MAVLSIRERDIFRLHGQEGAWVSLEEAGR